MTIHRLSLSRREFSSLLLGSLAFLPQAAVSAAPPRALRAPVRLRDAPMLDVRSGRQVRLVRDIMRDRAVALSFFFTGCSSTCPAQSMALSGAQRLLAGQLGPRAVFVSVSIDWLGDSPTDIRTFADVHRAGPHWHFLKAAPATVDLLRRGFDAFDPRRDEHPPVIAIGKADAGDWSRLYGLPQPAAIAREVQAWVG